MYDFTLYYMQYTFDFQYISARARLLKQSKAPVPCAERHRRAV